MVKQLALSLIAVACLGVGCVSSRSLVSPAPAVACPSDAQQCPDGNYVGRTGPGCEFVCPIAEQVSTSTPLARLTPEDAQALQESLGPGSILTQGRRLPSMVVPGGIVPAQFHTVYTLTASTFFGVIQRSNMNTPLPSDNGFYYLLPVSFAGLVVSLDSGQTWKQAFSLPTSTLRSEAGDEVRANVVGFFLQNGRYTVDIADDNGGGSGEGNLIRFSSVDGSRWVREPRCYYLVPEGYYSDVVQLDLHPELRGTLPPLRKSMNLKTQVCPAYAKQLIPFNER